MFGNTNNMVKLLNCGIDKLFDLSKYRRIYGFGVSKKLETYPLLRAPEYNLANIIYKLIDSDIKKCNLKYTFSNGKNVDIISIEQLQKEIEFDDIILVISMRYGEIIELLDHIPKLEGVSCYVLNFIDDYFDSCVDMKLYKETLSEKYLIPPTIHYCWFGKKNIPVEYQRYIESWRKYCPDYEIKLWNEDNYDIEKSSYVKWAYQNQKWEFVSDYARIDVLYRYGGIYLDTDVELIKNLDELRRFSAFMGFESKQMVNSGLGMGAQRGNPILKEFLEEYNGYADHTGTFDMVPCTVHQSNVLVRYGLRRNNTFQVLDNGNMVILPTEFLCGIRMYTKVKQITDNTFSIHHYAGDWGGKKQKREGDILRGKYNASLLKRVAPSLEHYTMYNKCIDM